MIELLTQAPAGPRPLRVAASPRILIGQAARRTGLTARAIRLYEAHGLISPPRDSSAVRYYDSAAVARLEHIAFLRRGGFTIRQITELLVTAEREGPAAQRVRMTELIHKRLAALNEQKNELERMMRMLAPPALSAAG